MPASRSERCAVTVVSRSSAIRTGVGAMRRRQLSASSIASCADGPVRSARVRGSPTTTSTRLELVDQLRQPAQVLVGLVAVPRHGLHRRGQDPVRIAGGDADADRAHVDAEPSAAAGVVAPGPIRQTVVWCRPPG